MQPGRVGNETFGGIILQQALLSPHTIALLSSYIYVTALIITKGVTWYPQIMARLVAFYKTILLRIEF